MSRELYIFARFRARPGCEDDLQGIIHEVTVPTAQEPGCIAIRAFRAIYDARLFFIHSQWRDEAAFEAHAQLPHTIRFIAAAEALIDHPLDVVRTRAAGD